MNSSRQTSPAWLQVVLYLAFAIVLSACDTGTNESYTYTSSQHVEPDSVVSNNNKTLVLRVKSVRPETCWELDKTLYGFSNDSIAPGLTQFRTRVVVSFKKKQTSVCAPKFDTLRSMITIRYDSASTYILRFDQTDAMGNYLERLYSYKVTD